MGIRFTPTTLFSPLPDAATPSRLDTPRLRNATDTRQSRDIEETAPSEQAAAPDEPEPDTTESDTTSAPAPTFQLFDVTPPGALLDLIA